LSSEVEQHESCKMALQRLGRVVEGCCERLVSRSSGWPGSQELIARRVTDTLRDLDSELSDALRASRSCSSSALPGESYDVLRSSLQTTQRRCEELSGNMLQQTDVNGELDHTLSTSKGA
ncbi:unnamed protein product, partial [Polarella glacialis]